MKVLYILVLVIVCSLLKAQMVSFDKAQQQHFDTHIVAHGETLYSLSKKYNTTVEVLLKMNPDIINNNLVLGKGIHVPVVQHKTWDSPEQTFLRKKDQPVIYKVEKGETVFSISKKFNTDVATILLWNDLKEPAIQEGQKLIVGYETPAMNKTGPWQLENKGIAKGEDESLEKSDAQGTPSAKHESTTELKMEDKSENEVLHIEKGIARWTYSTYDEGNFYALHATAPQGTEIIVKNLMNDKTVTVKVIGRLPGTSENENVLIKLSESAAKKLNVLDEKFLVEITYKVSKVNSVTGLN